MFFELIVLFLIVFITITQFIGTNEIYKELTNIKQHLSTIDNKRIDNELINIKQHQSKVDNIKVEQLKHIYKVSNVSHKAVTFSEAYGINKSIIYRSNELLHSSKMSIDKFYIEPTGSRQSQVLSDNQKIIMEDINILISKKKIENTSSIEWTITITTNLKWFCKVVYENNKDLNIVAISRTEGAITKVTGTMTDITCLITPGNCVIDFKKHPQGTTDDGYKYVTKRTNFMEKAIHISIDQDYC